MLTTSMTILLTFSVGKSSVGSELGDPTTGATVVPDDVVNLTTTSSTLSDGITRLLMIAPSSGMSISIVGFRSIKFTPTALKSSLLLTSSGFVWTASAARSVSMYSITSQVAFVVAAEVEVSVTIVISGVVAAVLVVAPVDGVVPSLVVDVATVSGVVPTVVGVVPTVVGVVPTVVGVVPTVVGVVPTVAVSVTIGVSVVVSGTAVVTVVPGVVPTVDVVVANVGAGAQAITEMRTFLGG